MNFALKPHQLVAHWVPGFLVTFVAAWVICVLGDCHLSAYLSSSPFLFMLVVVGFVVGEVLDAIRDGFLEDRFDHWNKVKWDFFFHADAQKLSNLDEFYYVYYVFQVNTLIGAIVCVFIIVAAAFTGLEAKLNSHPIANVAWLVASSHLVFTLAIVFLLTFGLVALVVNARKLRREVAEFTNQITGTSDPLPHEGVYTRLKPSQIDNVGIGVFAIRDIPEKTEIFAGGDDSEPRPLNRGQLDGLDAEVRKLYEDFCVIKEKGRRYACPINFNRMTIAWYLNHSKHPNVRADKELRFFASRRIKAGEELTVDYNTYNDWDPDDRPTYL